MEVASGPAAWNTSGVPCARAVSLTASSIDSKPKAAMTVERMFELVTDCLVCMGFSFLRFGLYFGFSGVFIVVPVHVRKRKGRLKPATTAQFFLIASGRAVKICLSVLQFAASSRLYDDALFQAPRGHPTARRVEQRRRRSAGEVVPASATRIAPARSPLHEPGARRPHPANHRHSQRSLPPTGR